MDEKRQIAIELDVGPRLPGSESSPDCRSLSCQIIQEREASRELNHLTTAVIIGIVVLQYQNRASQQMTSLLRISEASSLALHTMAILAMSPDRHLSTVELAVALRASEHTLAKVLQRLSRAELVDSLRGPSGGFVLGRPAEEIRLVQIVEAIEGQLHLSPCLLEVSLCASGECILGDLVGSINQQVVKHLNETSLAHLAVSVRACGYGRKAAREGSENTTEAVGPEGMT